MSGPFDIFGLGADPDHPEESPARKAQLASARPLPKRFYETVELIENDGFELCLDGRPVRTPARHVVKLANKKAAEELAEEWRVQRNVIDPKTMPLTRLVNSALDGVALNVASVQEEIVRFSGTDLLCYRADTPERLVAQQGELWDPVIKWAEERYDCRFCLAAGVLHVSQPEKTIRNINKAVKEIDNPIRVAALHSMTTLMGSCLLALSVMEKFYSAETAWQAAHVDEDWNIEQWGRDEEAEARRHYRWAEIRAAALLMSATVV